jgi:hypothetical protein
MGGVAFPRGQPLRRTGRRWRRCCPDEDAFLAGQPPAVAAASSSPTATISSIRSVRAMAPLLE